MSMEDAQTYADNGYYTSVVSIVPNSKPVVWFTINPAQTSTVNIVENYGIYATKQSKDPNVVIKSYTQIKCLLNTCWIWNGTSFQQDKVSFPTPGGVVIKNATKEFWVFGLSKQNGDVMSPICKVDVLNNLTCSMIPQEKVAVSIGTCGTKGTVIYNIHNFTNFVLPQSPDADTITGKYNISIATGNTWVKSP